MDAKILRNAPKQTNTKLPRLHHCQKHRLVSARHLLDTHDHAELTIVKPIAPSALRIEEGSGCTNQIRPAISPVHRRLVTTAHVASVMAHFSTAGLKTSLKSVEADWKLDRLRRSLKLIDAEGC